MPRLLSTLIQEPPSIELRSLLLQLRRYSCAIEVLSMCSISIHGSQDDLIEGRSTLLK